MKLARFTVSAELLHRLLLLPADAKVCDVRANPLSQEYDVTVTSESFADVANGEPVPLMRPMHRTVDGKAEFAGWNP